MKDTALYKHQTVHCQYTHLAFRL